MPPSLSGNVLKKKWKLGSLVGTGGCAEVYEAVDLKAESAGASAGPFVAKIAPLPVGLPPAMNKGKKRKKTEQEKHADMIYYEYTLYKGFLLEHGGVVEIPVGGYGEDQNLRYLVMSRLGPDVEAAQKEGEAWSVARKAGYARQMLDLLRTLHDKCKMIFVDVKPENFMFGLPGSADDDKIFLIDFGLSFRYTGPGGTIKPQEQRAQVQGTPEFLSLKCHGGASAGRCDDLESLGYVIVSMLKEGSTALPWSGSTSVASGLAAKKSTTLEALCEGCPSGMLKYMKAVRGMKHEEEPDYDGLDAMLKSMETSAAPEAGGGRAGAKAAKGKPKAAGGSGSSRSASARGASAKTATKRKSAKTPESEEEVEEVEVCEVESKGKGRPVRAQRGSKAEAVAKVPATPERKGQRTAVAVRRSRRLSSPKDEDEFFDALQEHDRNKKDSHEEEEEEEEEEEGRKEAPVVTRVVKSTVPRAARGASTAAGRGGRKATAKPKGVFLLEVVAGPHEGEKVQLSAGGTEVRVGRNAPRRNGLRLDEDLEVSDKHAILRPQSDGVSVEDLGSLNGSFVNEDRLEGTAVLRSGDVLQVGQTIVRVSN